MYELNRTTKVPSGLHVEGRAARSEWSIIRPRFGRNLITNGDFQRGMRGWAISLSNQILYLDPVRRFRGAYSLRLQPNPTSGNARTFYMFPPGGFIFVVGRLYSISGWARVSNPVTAPSIGLSASIGVITTFLGRASLTNARPKLEAGVWEYFSFSFAAVATSSPGIYLSFSSDSVNLADVQLEEGPPTTFISGDLSGPGIYPGDYGWEGEPGNSVSYRSANCARGGDVINLRKYGLRIISTVGLGLGALNHSMVAQAQGGASYQGTTRAVQGFSLVGDLSASSEVELEQRRAELIGDLHYARAGEDRPITLRRTPYGPGAEADVLAVFEAGMSAQRDNPRQERIALQFTSYLPQILRPQDKGQVLTGWQWRQSPVGQGQWGASTLTMLLDKRTGAWSTVAIGNAVYALERDTLGNFWVGTGGGAVPGIGRINPSTGVITTWGAFTGTFVDRIYVAPSGRVYVSGTFTQIGGIAATNLAVYNPVTNAWSAFGNPNGLVRSVLQFGNAIYVGGSFTNIGGSAITALAVTADNGSSFSAPALGFAPVTRVNRMVPGPDGLMYLAGELNANQSFVIRYDALDVVQAFNSSLIFAESFAPDGRRVEHMTAMPDGRVYFLASASAGSKATELYQADGANVAKRALTLTHNLAGNVSVAALWEREGRLLVNNGTAGTPTQINGVRVISSLYEIRNGAVTNDRIWLDLGGYTTNPGRLEAMAENNLYAIYATSTLSSPARMALPAANIVSAYDEVSPRITILGPGLLTRIENTSTGQALEFNLRIEAAETLVIDTATGVITSSVRGQIQAGVLSQAAVSAFRLKPGDNTVYVSLWPDLTVLDVNPIAVFGDSMLGNISRSSASEGQITATRTGGVGTGGTLTLTNAQGVVLGTAVKPDTLGNYVAITPGTSVASVTGFVRFGDVNGVTVIRQPIVEMSWESRMPSLDYTQVP